MINVIPLLSQRTYGSSLRRIEGQIYVYILVLLYKTVTDCFFLIVLVTNSHQLLQLSTVGGNSQGDGEGFKELLRILFITENERLA